MTNNQFYIKGLKNVVLLGYADYFDKIENINAELNLNTFFISTPSYKKNFKHKKNVKFFNKIDYKLKSFIKNKNLNNVNTLFISFGCRWIFKKKQIHNIFWNNLVNFHGSRLPVDSGGGGFSWRIMRGDRLGSNLVHLIDEGIDTGPIIDFEEYIFPNKCKKPIDFDLFYSRKFIPFYYQFIKKIKNKKKFKLLNQNKSLSLYNPRLKTKINGWINWDWKAEDIFNFINAFDEPYDGASTKINNKFKVKIKDVHLHKGEISSHPYSKGLVIRKSDNWLIVSLGGNHNLIIEKILDNSNKNILKMIKVGDRLITGDKEKQKSLVYRATYK